MVTFWFVPMLPGLKGGTGTPTTPPAALAEAEVETPVVCCRNPGKMKSAVTVTRPDGPPNVKKLGLPLVLVARWSCWPPPLRSLFRIKPLPTEKVTERPRGAQTGKAEMHWSSWLSGTVGRPSQAPVKHDAGRREAKRLRGGVGRPRPVDVRRSRQKSPDPSPRMEEGVDGYDRVNPNPN